jgi:indolepyruvate ferredoxin oxidoreductase, beta subunit
MNILVCGVGGQGVLLFSNIIADLALTAELDVKKSEVHGMAQRGGSVTSHIRYAPKVASPLIEEGTADIIVAFEMMEALRYIHFLRPGGQLIYDSHRIDPLPVSTGAVERPTDQWLEERIAERLGKAENRDASAASPTQPLGGSVPHFPPQGTVPDFSALHGDCEVRGGTVRVPAFQAALKLGNARVQNVVMLGAISTSLEFPEEDYRQAITRLVKPKVVELNLKAFAEGRALCTRA